MKHFEEGRKHLFLEALDVFAAANDWDAIFSLCLGALGKTNEDGSLDLLGSDLAVWRRFIHAATRQLNEEKYVGLATDPDIR